MRAILAWIFTIWACFAAFFGVATLVLLPIQAARNRATYAVVERYAHKLVETSSLPKNTDVDDAFTSTTDGMRIWSSLPGGCHDTAFEASSDRFALGFWENGKEDRFGAIWWQCYAYPSGKTTMSLSVTDYLRSAAGQQVAAYFLLAGIGGILAWAFRTREERTDMATWAKTVWIGVTITLINIFYLVQDSGDDEFYKNPDFIKWFTVVYENTIGLVTKVFIAAFDYLPSSLVKFFIDLWPLTVTATWLIMGWGSLRLFALAKSKFGIAGATDIDNQ